MVELKLKKNLSKPSMLLVLGLLPISLLMFSSCGSVSRIDCSGYYHPVCGSDGKTYDNDCYANLARGPSWLDGSCPFPQCSSEVCGSDGKTYPSDCFAKLSGIELWIDGTCPFPSDGIFVHFKMNDERVRMYLTRSDSIQDAKDNLAGKNQKHIPIGKVRAGRLFDPQWSWYIDPETITLAEQAIELCDAAPSYLEQHLDQWLNHDWCPWSAQIESIEE